MERLKQTRRAKNVLEYLERSAYLWPDKEAYEDQDGVISFAQTMEISKKIGTAIAESVKMTREPVAVFLDKNIQSILSFFGVVYSGNFYCPLDVKMPSDRIVAIISVLKPRVVVTDYAHRDLAEGFAGDSMILVLAEILEKNRDQKLLDSIRLSMTELDPLYVLFTSGSTGVPKGVLLSHRVVTNYMEWLGETFDMDETTVFGNQSPFYFDVSVHDIYGAIYFGAKTVIIPQSYFSFPLRLIEFLNEKQITTFMWVPSAMAIIADLKAFGANVPKYLKQIMFAGEVLQRRQLDYWVEYIPDAVYANLYGPTETFVCTAYIRTGNEKKGQPLPIGTPILNSQALILDENGKESPYGEEGELCMRGTCLALGYYNDPEKTEKTFVQNPLHNRYPDRIYHTGDLVRYDEKGNLIYVSRKDFQIKHMGYRIELGEIETAASAIEGIRECACTYDDKRKRIILIYDGMELEKRLILNELEKKIPQYMMPGKIVHLDKMPHNANGKINRLELQKHKS